MAPRRRRRGAALECVLALRRADPLISLTDAIMILYVAENPGINMSELADVAGLNLATASRCARSLSDPATPGSLPPYSGLLAIEPNPQDPRGRILRLSDAGEGLRRHIDEAIQRGVLTDGSAAR